jgi:putative endopeptidase
MLRIICSALLAILLFSCNTKKTKGGIGSAELANDTKTDVLQANADTTVSPAADFFDFANGGWVKKNPIPGEESSWGIGNLVVEENLKRIRIICEDAAKNSADKGTATQQIGNFWKAAMDSTKIESDGIKPLQPYLDKVNGVKDVKELLVLMADFEKIGMNGLIGLGVGQDAKNSEVNTVQCWQGGIGLPERKYYFENDATTKNIRTEYVKYMGRMLRMIGADSATADKAAVDLMAVETQIAKVHRKLEDLRDPYANYNKTSVPDMYKLAPGVDWNAYLAQRGIAKVDSIIVGQPEYLKEVDRVLKAVPLPLWKHYLNYRLAHESAEMLPDTFSQARFNFRKLFSGAKERKPRWKRVLQTQENAMGELMGQLYVKEFFNETAKKRYEDMVEAVRDAYKERIEKLSWMSDSTKQKALVKLAAIKKKVGYPEKWKDFSKMEIGSESYLQNMVNASRWWDEYQLNKLGKPVDRDEWVMTPQTYNAYYNPGNNEIVLPAGIFTVPGYRDEELDDATVYGYGGASTIGHEITHGFDDEGRQFDAKGNLVSWWTKADETEFKKRADVMVKQFDGYVVIDKMNINGKATLGENIADLGGILLGIDAFKKTEQFKKGEKLAGYTPMQRYFMGYALGWMGHTRPEQLKNQLMTDVHSPAKYRVNGPFSDVDEFYTTFNIKPGDAMFIAEDKRVRIW